MRACRLEGLQARIHNHVARAKAKAASLVALPGVVIVTQPSLSRFTLAPAAGDDATDALFTRINDDGWIYLTQTKAQGRFVIRVKVEKFGCTGNDVAMIAPWLWN